MLKLLVNIQVHAVGMNLIVDILMNLELEYEQLPQYCDVKLEQRAELAG